MPGGTLIRTHKQEDFWTRPGFAIVNREKGERPPPNWGKLKTTPVFDSYWWLAAERQNIFFSRLRQEPGPWTTDIVLQQHKFTNAYRASDRVSQYLINKVIYSGEQSPSEWFFRIILFKFFNRIETWELLEKNFGELSWERFSASRYDEILTKAMDSGERIYSAAYIMPSGGRSAGFGRKHQMHLHLLERMMKDKLHEKIASTQGLNETFSLLKSYPSIGNFLAYQYAIDLNYSPLTNHDEDDFVCAGPGACDGIKKCFSNTSGYNEEEIIRMMTLRQEDEFDRLGLQFFNLWGRRLHLIDCQNLFCEVDKYARVAHPEASGHTGRTRIKQKFRPTSALLVPAYPPKWRINHLIRRDV